jgi:hypothetical protein
VSEAPLRNKRRAVLAVGAGALLAVTYFLWLLAEPRGLFEFGYAPFGPTPLPYSAMRGFTYEQLWGHVARALLLAPGLLLLSVGWTVLGWRTPKLDRRRALVGASVVCVGLTGFCMLVILRGRAIVDDELVYRMQATFLGEGRWAAQLGGLTPPDVFTVATRVGYTGKYLPGEPLVQVLGLRVGIPALLHLPLLALTLLAWRQALRLRLGQPTADHATIALALSPTLMLTSATGMSETTSFACVALSALGYEWARARQAALGALLAALGFGFGMLTRPQTMLPVGAVLGPAVLYVLVKRRGWFAVAVLAFTLALFGFAIGAYDQALGGSPLELPWFLQCGQEHFGFGRVWATELFEHTPWTALENLGVVLVRFNAWWLGLPCSLAVLVVWFSLPRSYRKWDIWYAIGLAIIGFEFLYYSPGISDTGSLYHFELVLPGSIIAARVFEYGLANLPRFTAAALTLHFALAALPFGIEQTARLSRLVDAIHADSDRVLARIEPPAILFHETRASESRPTGWVFDSFPERNRGTRDAIVTFPNVPERERARVLAAYPGRACWYYHRDPVTESVELKTCEAARALMDRTPTDDALPLWTRPTAYRLTNFNPLDAARLGHVRDAQGERVPLCCALEQGRRLGVPLKESLFGRCIADHR